MNKILKYNGSKSSDSRRQAGSLSSGTTTGIPTNEGKNTANGTASINRVIWGQIDNGSEVQGDILIEGNGYIVDTEIEQGRIPEDMEEMFETAEGNLFVEHGIKAESGNFENVDADNVKASSGNFNIVNTGVINASTGVIQNLSGNELNYLKGYVKDLLSENLTTDYLTVTKLAHFFELQIDKLRSVGGSIILSPADGFIVDRVVHAGNAWRLFYRSEQDGKRIDNQFIAGD